MYKPVHVYAEMPQKVFLGSSCQNIGEDTIYLQNNIVLGIYKLLSITIATTPPFSPRHTKKHTSSKHRQYVQPRREGVHRPSVLTS